MIQQQNVTLLILFVCLVELKQGGIILEEDPPLKSWLSQNDL